MQKPLGIVALIVAIISIFIPLIGPYLTVISAICAALAWGSGLALGIAALVLNLINIFVMSPSIWLTMAANSAAEAQGKSFLSVGTFLFLVQIGSGAFAIWRHQKSKASSVGALK
jgi:hypothetical protein